MFSKTFDEMFKIDVSKYTKKRDDENDYLPWGTCKKLLHDNGAERVYFEPCTNENGSSLFMSDHVFTDKNGITNRCYEVRVKVVIDSLEFEAQFPLMNGSNPVKDNSLTQQRVWNAQTRAFVKGVAIHTGLGFSLWLNDDTEVIKEDDLSKHSLFSINERLQKTYTKLLRTKGMTTGEIANACGKTEDEIKTIFTYFAQLDRFEQQLNKLL